jgi:hypothetical protein
MARVQDAQNIANYIEVYGHITYKRLASRYKVVTPDQRKKVMAMLKQIGPYKANRVSQTWYAV